MTVIATLVLDVNEQEIIVGVLDDLLIYLTGILNKIQPIILKHCKILVVESIKQSPEYAALQPGGDLYGQIGNPNIHYDLEKIIEEIAESVVVQIEQPKIINQQIEGAITVIIDSRNYLDILYLQQANYSRNGEVLPWLRWLLLEGNSAIIIGYVYNPNSGFNVSATHQGVMQKSKDSSWRIPDQYQGTDDNNFITRSLIKISTEITKTMEDEFNNNA